jgi:iron complex outermembrane receptor protein
MQIRLPQLYLGALVSAVLVFTAAPAQAQSRPGGSGMNTGGVLEEIYVTARKREEGLQNTPISVSAFTGAGLDYRGVTNIGEISAFTPNLTFQNNPSFGGAGNTASIYIRGIGQKEFLPTVEPGVGLYVDGVYIARSVGAILDLIDIERVEVLRGPQGTLFGRNTIGGAINITTRKPQDSFAGRAEVSYGTDDRINARGSVNLPVADNLFVSLAGASLNQEGYVTRDDGIDLGDDGTLTGRAAFLWLVNPDLEIHGALEGTRDRENGPAMSLLAINYAGPIDPDTPPMATIHNVGASLAAGGPAAPCAFPGMTLNLAVPGCYDDRYVTGGNAGTAAAYSSSDLWAANLNISWTINDQLQAKSITGYRNLDSRFARDGDHSPHRVSQFADTLEQEQFTQELQLLGAALDSRLNWILGFYYFHEQGNNVNLLDFTVSRFRSGGAFDNTSMAVFAQGTYDVTDQLHFTAGLRYTDDEKHFTPDQIIFQNYFAGSGHPQLDAPFMQAGQRILPLLEKTETIDEFTPYLNLSYDFSDSLMAYASYSEGFKSGGFSQRVFPPIVVPFTAPPGTADIDLIPSFAPEFVQVYEAGFKYTGANGRLRVNGAVFYTDYADLQVQVFTSVAPVTKNVGSASLTGFELELQAIPADNWLLEAGLGYINAEYDEIDTTTTFIAAGNEFERAPEWTLSAALSREFPLSSDMGMLIPRLDWSYRSDFFNDSFNTPVIATKSYHLLNANITWHSPAEKYSLILGARNLGDEHYLMSGDIGDAFQSAEGILDRGRQFYVTARLDF